MRQIFKAKAHDLAIQNDGYVILDGLDISTIEKMQGFFQTNSNQNFTGWQHSLELTTPSLKTEIFKFLTQVYDEQISKHLIEYRSISATFVSKKSDPDSLVNLHQDWSFVREPDFASLNIWIPLCDTNENNGMLTVLKGSHRLKEYIRGTRIPLGVRLSSKSALKHLTHLPMKRGSLLFYNHRMVHGSAVNRSGNPRTAASISVIPSEATPIHYQKTYSGITELEVDAKFYQRYFVTKGNDALVDDDYNLITEGYKKRQIECHITTDRDQEVLELYESALSGIFRQFKNKRQAKT